MSNFDGAFGAGAGQGLNDSSVRGTDYTDCPRALSPLFPYHSDMDITVTVDLNEIAEQVNEEVGDDAETGASVKTWIEHNPSGVKNCIISALIAEIAENYA